MNYSCKGTNGRFWGEAFAYLVGIDPRIDPGNDCGNGPWPLEIAQNYCKKQYI